MAIEKFSTLKPAPGQGKRILKSKLLTALGATGVLRPFPQNPEHILERKILLQTPFINGFSGGVAPPCTAGLTFASAWAAQVVTNGGASPSQATQNAVANFQCSLISAGLDSQMITWTAFASDGFIAATTPQLGSNSNVQFQNVNGNFVSADLGTGGLKGDGTSKILQVLANPVFGLTTGQSLGAFVYVTAVATSTNGRSTGDIDGGALLLAAQDNTNNCFAINGANPANLIQVASRGNGFYSTQRVSNVDHRFWFANGSTPLTQLGATDVTAYNGGLPTGTFYIFCLDSGGGATFGLTAERMGMWGLTKGLNQTQVGNLASSIQTFMTALGRNV